MATDNDVKLTEEEIKGLMKDAVKELYKNYENLIRDNENGKFITEDKLVSSLCNYLEERIKNDKRLNKFDWFIKKYGTDTKENDEKCILLNAFIINSENIDSENMNLENTNPENTNSENMNFENKNSENMKSESMNPENKNSENTNSENMNFENKNSENMNLENTNSENMKSESMNPENKKSKKILLTFKFNTWWSKPEEEICDKLCFKYHFCSNIAIGKEKTVSNVDGEAIDEESVNSESVNNESANNESVNNESANTKKSNTKHCSKRLGSR